LNHSLQLVAHFIADGLGVFYASGLTKSTVLKELVGKLIEQLAIDRRVLWDTWFLIASVVYLGCPWEGKISEVDDGASSIVVAQYGSSIIVVKWVDITSEHSVSGCFGIIVDEGQLCSGFGDVRDCAL
jgi:hypothetical protein